LIFVDTAYLFAKNGAIGWIALAIISGKLLLLLLFIVIIILA